MYFLLISALLTVATIEKSYADNPIYNETWMNSFSQSSIDDGDLSFTELAHKYGYPAEEHTVTTKDNYILKFHRIPHGKNGSTRRQVVFLMHGFLCSSIDWIIIGSEIALGYYLADNGYDVWLGNARGNKYSKNHTEYSTDSKEFWDFSWHEIAIYDIPAMVDYIVSFTGQEKMFYVGHSQGNTVFYVLTSEKPEYNDKFYAQISLSPVAFMEHVKSPVMRAMALLDDEMEVYTSIFGMFEFFPNNGILHQISQIICDEGPLELICENALFLIAGFDKDQFNASLISIVTKQTPAGSSVKQILHYAQLVNSGEFRQYDYGILENLKLYQSWKPPNYKLNKITSPVYLFYSNNDWLSDEKDVNRLEMKLKNVAGKVLCAGFNHLDYLYGIYAPNIVYSKVLNLIKNIHL